MTAYVALIRAVNVGGRQLKMADLMRIAEELKLGSPRTYIASGNLVFTSDKSERALKSALETAIGNHWGVTVDVLVRTAGEMADAVMGNPFGNEPRNRVAAIFLDEPPPAHALDAAKGVADERMALGVREIYVHYPSGMGQSKLRIPAMASGTARNMNTVTKLAELAEEMA
ncbi:DUF1697 domain-containing protein [Sphingomonas sp. URHD0057]|uniref:DUF1697 domain-containing protein n=1 Tax=Sphingomonas sp. URHD0057 TaxID=1380389 RepID=UPI00048B8A3B|nr:DUF1697 domain-containing protein [Sphingomonas sp. URHD0057]